MLRKARLSGILSFPHHPDTYAIVINIILSRGLGINLSTQIVRKLAFIPFTDFTSRETVRNRANGGLLSGKERCPSSR
jgi:hypothetical protein